MNLPSGLNATDVMTLEVSVNVQRETDPAKRTWGRRILEDPPARCWRSEKS